MRRCTHCLRTHAARRAPLSLLAQSVRYEVAVARGAFHVTAEFPTGGKDTLLVSLPAWSPGKLRNPELRALRPRLRGAERERSAVYWDRADKDTWRVATGRSDRVTVEFDYSSDTIDLSIARASQDFAQFLGTNLFMFEEGQWSRPAEVRFRFAGGMASDDRAQRSHQRSLSRRRLPRARGCDDVRRPL